MLSGWHHPFLEKYVMKRNWKKSPDSKKKIFFVIFDM
jgi:hypothetical protein